MGLAEAVAVIADAIESDSKSLDEGQLVQRILAGYARELRIALKASEPAAPLQSVYTFDEVARTALMKRAKQEQDEVAQLAALAERGPATVELVGGPCDAEMVPADSGMPVGANTFVEGSVYTKQVDGRLHFNEALTAKHGKPVATTNNIVLGS